MTGLSSKSAVREKVTSELKDLFYLTAYLFVAFAALTFYKSAALEARGIYWVPWGFAIVKALVSAKFILIGQAFHVGEGGGNRPLSWQTLHKSAVFLILVAGLTVIEEAIVGAIHGKGLVQSISEIGGGTTEQLIATAVIMFLLFLPLFAFGALGEVMGKNALFRTFFEDRLEFEVAEQRRQNL